MLRHSSIEPYLSTVNNEARPTGKICPSKLCPQPCMITCTGLAREYFCIISPLDFFSVEIAELFFQIYHI